jgi:hypothetical protein
MDHRITVLACAADDAGRVEVALHELRSQVLERGALLA